MNTGNLMIYICLLIQGFGVYFSLKELNLFEDNLIKPQLTLNYEREE